MTQGIVSYEDPFFPLKKHMGPTRQELPYTIAQEEYGMRGVIALQTSSIDLIRVSGTTLDNNFLLGQLCASIHKWGNVKPHTLHHHAARTQCQIYYLPLQNLILILHGSNKSRILLRLATALSDTGPAYNSHMNVTAPVGLMPTRPLNVL